MLLFLSTIFSIFFGFSSSSMAKRQGRDERVWFILGFLFGLFAVLYLYFFPKEQQVVVPVEKDQKVIEESTIAYDSPIREWFLLDEDDHQKGPIAFSQLIEKLNQKEITKETYVWTEGMGEWKPIKEISILSD